MDLLKADPASLIRLAALVWFAGVPVLLLKSMGMLGDALGMGAPLWSVVWAVIAGLGIGAVKAKYLFIGLCKQNIQRIYALKSPKVWQFYRTRFYFFLFLMITLGHYAHHLSRDSVFLLLALSVLELSVSTALFISGNCFRNKG